MKVLGIVGCMLAAVVYGMVAIRLYRRSAEAISSMSDEQAEEFARSVGEANAADEAGNLF